MKLDERLWIYSYKMKSESAILLAEKLDVWMIKYEGSKFHGEKGQFILNWGAGTGIYGANTGRATVLNRPEVVDVAVNKLDFFRTMEGFNGPRIPFWTTSDRKAKSWIGHGETVIGRERLEGAKGIGLLILKTEDYFKSCPLYTLKVKNVQEFRVYTFFDQVVDARIKISPDHNPDKVMVGDNVEFIQTDLDKVPEDCLVQTRKAAKALGLTTCGFDVVWDGFKAYVLEANSAPYLGIQTAKKYAEVIKKYVEAK